MPTSGIILLTNFINDLKCDPNIIFLKISILLFVLAILANLISQIVAYRANIKQLEVDREKIYDLNYSSDSFDQEKYKAKEKKAGTLSKRVDLFNNVSIWLVVAGILIATITFWVVVA